MSDQHQRSHDIPGRADAQNAWSFGILPSSTCSHDYSQARLGGAQSYSFRGPDQSRRNANSQLSRYHHYGMRSLSPESSEARWPDKLFTVNSGHGLWPMERVSEISLASKKHLDRQDMRSVDNKDPPSMMRAHPPLIRSTTDPFPRGANLNPYFGGGITGLPPYSYGSRDGPDTGSRAPGLFLPDTVQQHHHDPSHIYRDVDSSDEARPGALDSSGSPNDSRDEIGGFPKANDGFDRRSSIWDEDRDSLLSDLFSLDVRDDAADMSESQPCSPNSWNMQFAQHRNDVPRSPDANVSLERSGSQRKKKKSKMHQCPICQKLFPRPSGLRTHENSHTGNKPFTCQYPKCKRAFGVASNAKRHLRSHGILPEQNPDTPTPYTVGFNPPVVQSVEHPWLKVPTKFRWVPLNPSPTASSEPSEYISTTSALCDALEELHATLSESPSSSTRNLA